MALALLIIWYMHKQTEKKDADVISAREENKDLVKQLIDDKEKRLIADQENRELLKRLIDKNGDTYVVMREAFDRMENNQRLMLEELRRFKEKH